MSQEPQDNYSAIYLSSTDTDLPEGFSNDFKKYRSFQDMSGGGNGVLIACNDMNLGRKVAIKKLHSDKASDGHERKRLLREARITAQLQHPNTVPVYELGKTDDGQIYFSMKKIEGEDLFKILCRIARDDEIAKEEYSLDKLLGIIVQASNALAYAHNRGVIHRDVKPENILIGLFGNVYLMDWGVAKVWGMPNDVRVDEVSKTELFERLTGTGKRPGTPLYMSPEQVNDRVVDERTDIFSMGVVLYEVLAIREPFRGRTIDETFDNILNLEPPPPSAVSQHLKVPKALDAICARALRKKPEDRYQNMVEMIRDIRRFREAAMLSADQSASPAGE
jgi:serine/threonine-protein kinase